MKDTNIISSNSETVKLSTSFVYVKKSRQTTVYKNGVISAREYSGLVNTSGLLRNGRNKSKGQFSIAARRRLRMFVVQNDIPNSKKFSLTLTLPNNSNLKSNFDYSDCVNRFGIYFRRKYKTSGYIWRNELQSRGVPHTHILLYLPMDLIIPSLPSDYNDWSLDLQNQYQSARHAILGGGVFGLFCDIRRDILSFWHRAVKQCVWMGSEAQWSDYKTKQIKGLGFNFRFLEYRQQAIRYIVDDMSKHKLEQLGYLGNQWGVVGRKNFVIDIVSEIQDDKIGSVIRRIIGRLRRYRIPCPAPFGWKHSKYHVADCGASYLSDDSIAKLTRLIRD